MDILLKRLQRFFGMGALAGIKTDADLDLIGAANLRYLVRHLRSGEKELTEQLGEAKDIAKTLNAPEAVLRAQQGPKGLADVELVPAPEGAISRLAPTERTLQSTRCGDTTLRLCGWCKFRAPSGVLNGDALMAGDCGLLEPLNLETCESVVEADTPCKVMLMPDGRRQDLARLAVLRAVDRKDLRDELRAVIGAIRELEKDAVDRPLFPAWRPSEAFGLGDKVVVWLHGLPELTTRVAFITGKVVPGFRHHDGVVNVETDKRVSRSEYKHGRGVTAGCHNHKVMAFGEFWALRNAAMSPNPQEQRFFEMWADQGDLGEREMLAFIADMHEGEIAGT